MAETVATEITPSNDELTKTINQVATDAALGDQNIPLEVKVGAQVFKGTTPQELLGELTKAQENATNLIRQQKEELERLRQEHVTRVQTPPADEQAYSSKTYYELLAEDPRKAHEYNDRFDPDRQEFKHTLEGLRRQSEIDRFRSAVSFAPTQEEAMTFGQEFTKSGLQPSADNFELVFYRLVNQGKIQPPRVSSAQGHPAPPPTLGGGSSSQPSGGFDMNAFENLPTDQQAQVIARLKSQGWR